MSCEGPYVEAKGKGYCCCGLSLPLRLHPLFIATEAQFLNPGPLAPKLYVERRYRAVRACQLCPHPNLGKFGQEAKKMDGVSHIPIHADYKHGMMCVCHLRK